MRIANVAAILVPSMLLAACATGGASAGRAPVAPVLVTPQGDLTLVDPRLPDADRQLTEIREEAGDIVSALVNFCVAPDGHVERVKLLRRSSSPAFDMAVMRDLSDWEFTGEAPAASRPETCETATISYHVPL
jgi:TonB family protein